MEANLSNMMRSSAESIDHFVYLTNREFDAMQIEISKHLNLWEGDRKNMSEWMRWKYRVWCADMNMWAVFYDIEISQPLAVSMGIGIGKHLKTAA